MESFHIVDSNVLAIANELHDFASAGCVSNAITFLKNVKENIESSEDYKIVLDDLYEVLVEYTSHVTKFTNQRIGSAFLKWLFKNLTKTNIVMHRLPEDIEENPELFPECFSQFDRNDRKYLFLALQHNHQNSTIHYGIDRGYIRFSDCFDQNNITLDQICG